MNNTAHGPAKWKPVRRQRPCAKDKSFAVPLLIGQSGRAGNNLETMSLNRRNFIAGSAALASTPALGAVSASGEVDVAIVGAGAAGIAAARKVAAAGRRYVLLEANDRFGGRCLTDTNTFGVPYDRGAHWLHVPEINPLARLAARRVAGSPAPPAGKLRT